MEKTTLAEGATSENAFGDPDVLVIDDTIANLQLLVRVLQKRGFKVRAVTDGHLGLQAAALRPPDVVLLDVCMPGLNGYEVCERMKADPALKDVPIIFLSALNEEFDKVRAFSAGAVDYITKPFGSEEVLARLNTHLRIRRLQDELQDRYDKLRELEALQQSLTHMIVHDLRSPLSAVHLYLEMLLTALQQKDQPELATHARGALQCVDATLGLITDLLDVGRIESGQMPLVIQLTSPTSIAQQAVERLGPRAQDPRLHLHLQMSSPPVFADAQVAVRVLVNLLDNAFRYTPEDGQVALALATEEDCVRVSVRDSGPGIAPEYHSRVFEKFGQVLDPRGRTTLSSGLGLTFCRMAVEAMGGTIGLESKQNQGSTFWFTLPLSGRVDLDAQTGEEQPG